MREAAHRLAAAPEAGAESATAVGTPAPQQHPIPSSLAPVQGLSSQETAEVPAAARQGARRLNRLPRAHQPRRAPVKRSRGRRRRRRSCSRKRPRLEEKAQPLRTSPLRPESQLGALREAEAAPAEAAHETGPAAGESPAWVPEALRSDAPVPGNAPGVAEQGQGAELPAAPFSRASWPQSLARSCWGPRKGRAQSCPRPPPQQIELAADAGAQLLGAQPAPAAAPRRLATMPRL